MTNRLERRMNDWLHRAEELTEGSDERARAMAPAERLAEQIGKRTGTNPLTKTTVANRGPDRRCSYCKYKHGAWSDHGRGHTRRTCQTLKDDMAQAIKVNAQYRAGILESLRDAGAGVGALMSMHISGYFPTPDGDEKWDRRACPVMVRRVSWDDINYTATGEDFIQTQRMDMMGTREGYSTLSGPYRYTEDETGQRHALRFSGDGWGTTGPLVGSWEPAAPAEPERTRIYVLSQVPAETINPPSGWLNGESAALIAHFKTLKQ
jgi:hypothetical protein